MLKNYLKIAFRNIFRHKGYSFINITGLAAGIACCMLIMLYVQDELNYDKYHEKIDRLYRLERAGVFQDQVYRVPVTAHPTGPAFENDIPEILHAVRIWPTELTVKSRDNHYFEEKIFFADAAVFDTFTFPLVKGSPGTALREPNSIVLTERMSKKYFNSIDCIGKTLSVKWNEDTVDFKVSGIMKEIPHNSHFRTDFFASYSTLNRLIANQLNAWLSNSVYTYLLLPENLSPGELEKKFPPLVEKYMGKDVRKFLGPDVDISSMMRYVLHPVSRIHLYSNLRWEIEPNSNINTVYIFSIIAFLVLLIACINFMNLSTARSANRAKEVGLRKTVGANKSLLVKQFIGESLFLALIAGIIAVFLVEFLLPMYNTFTSKEMSNKYLTDPLFIISFIAVILFVGFVSGSYPAFYLSSFQPIKVMRGTLKTGTDNRSRFLRKGLVVLQFTISIVLIIGTIVVKNQLTFLKNKNLGFKKEQVVVIPAKDNSLLNKYDVVKSELTRNPKILKVATSSRIPGDRIFPDRVFLREGMNSDQSKDIIFFHIDTDFIPLLGIELSAGRNFSENFTTDKTEGFILNESAVKLLGWETPEMAVGKGILIPESPGKYQKGRIVGVVKDFHFKSLHQKIEPLILYMDPQRFRYITVKISTEDIPSTLDYLGNKFKAFSPGFTFEYFFLEDSFDKLYRSEERIQTIFNSFTILAILISCLGLFGLASFTAEQRTREVGIRKVLGATVPDIITQLSREFITWVLMANIIAWPVAFIVMNKWLQNFAYRTDPGIGTFIMSGLIALVIALLTVSYQSVKTALANPIHALKYE
jgi:putative ABC transport system permease protein